MKRRTSDTAHVFKRWQHLEFFQWYTRTFNAVRSDQFKDSLTSWNTSVLKITTHGVGLAYAPARGTAIVWLPPGERVFRSILYDTFHPVNLQPDLSARMKQWRDVRLPDLRQNTMLAAILSYQPHQVHPNRR